ncbi:MAG: protein pafC [Acidimicrobiia bacterium]|nr:MAG: protein pafC [Acidimicrobiia bacterium]
MSPRPVAETEIQRILALVPWIVGHPGTTKDAIARRFGISVAQLERDLALVCMIGVPPYSPGDYLDVEEGPQGEVTIRMADTFRRPLRLSPAEGLALLAAGRALLAVPGSDPDGPLATALGKLERALGVPDLVVEVARPPHLDAVRDAVARHERVEIDYWSAGRDELATRRIDPAVVFFALGAWYVGAYCHRAGAERMFRVDRIRALRPTGERFTPPETRLGPGEVYSPAPGDARVTLRLAPAAAWVAEHHPTESVTERPDGHLDVVLTVSERGWLERLLLRLGDDAAVLEPPQWRDAAAEAARRVLARYTGGPDEPRIRGRRAEG